VTPIKKILVPLDGSELSQAALPAAEDIAEPFGASIILFHAVTPPVTAFPGAELAHMDQHVWEAVLNDARDYLRKIAGDISARGRSAQEIVTIASSVDGILEATTSQSAGLIAISTHGRSGVGRWIMGSVADGVIRRSPVPVLVVRPAGHEN
jgi:nucleotide-binding universal stress UspA family protein